MTMRPCPECAGGVSNAAFACPHCGLPLRVVDSLAQVKWQLVAEKMRSKDGWWCECQDDVPSIGYLIRQGVLNGVCKKIADGAISGESAAYLVGWIQCCLYAGEHWNAESLAKSLALGGLGTGPLDAIEALWGARAADVDAIDTEGLAEGVEVEHVRDSGIGPLVISSIRRDGRVFFKGGGAATGKNHAARFLRRIRPGSGLIRRASGSNLT